MSAQSCRKRVLCLSEGRPVMDRRGDRQLPLRRLPERRCMAMVRGRSSGLCAFPPGLAPEVVLRTGPRERRQRNVRYRLWQ